MKLIKRIPFQIFILVLFAGIVGIVGMFIMQYRTGEIVENYEQIIDKNLQDRLGISEFQNLMYRHQVIISWHMFASSDKDKSVYKEEANTLEALIMDKLEELGGNISGSEKEQLFHKVYSDAIGYFQKASNVFTLSEGGNTATAEYYIVSDMSKYMNSINTNVGLMDGYIDEEMNLTREKMETSITAANISEIVCSLAIVVVMVVCLILCVRITYNLENYKNRLEVENESKTREIMERNIKMLAIQE
ncbi:MAG: MCP four helix bundle domain-containing protein, partial [Oscillospiraceae bacterium]|nr:MCP four helix bundle domain-containing protein [Oscillospiraceae bacterium]